MRTGLFDWLFNNYGEYEQREKWDRIADQWYEFRHYPLLEVKDFAMFIAKQPVPPWPLKKNVLDIGAGAGRNLLPFKNHHLFALDFSGKMLKQVKKYSKKFDLDATIAKGSATALPFKDNFFDAVLCVATLHCVETKEERLECLKEMKRVMKPGGFALISVWNRWQWRFFPRNIFLSDVYVPWHRQTEVIKRFYHTFSYGELEELAKKAGFDIIKTYPELKYSGFKNFSENIFAIVQKPA